MYASSSNSGDSSCSTIYSDKLLKAIVETFKASKGHLTARKYPHNQYVKFF